MLGAAMGDTITLHCNGDGCDEALDRLSALVTERFGED
jgi:phosphotransferase system HPr-like phosphotransfer protein